MRKNASRVVESIESVKFSVLKLDAQVAKDLDGAWQIVNTHYSPKRPTHICLPPSADNAADISPASRSILSRVLSCNSGAAAGISWTTR